MTILKSGAFGLFFLVLRIFSIYCAQSRKSTHVKIPTLQKRREGHANFKTFGNVRATRPDSDLFLLRARGVFRIEEKPAPFTKTVKSAAPGNSTYPQTLAHPPQQRHLISQPFIYIQHSFYSSLYHGLSSQDLAIWMRLEAQPARIQHTALPRSSATRRTSDGRLLLSC